MKIVVGFVILFVSFGLIEKLWPLKRSQKIFRDGWFTDVIHFFVSHLLVQILVVVLAIPLYLLLGNLVSPDLKIAVTTQPRWLQFLEGLVIAELIFYTGHRLAHHLPWWWRLHTIHHSSPNLDWLASSRLHPLDQALGKVLVGVPLVALGFTKEVFGIYLAVTSIQALFVHANVRCRFGFLRWVIVTPEFHHWHHSLEAVNKNFAGQLPVIDLIFGTLYLPPTMPQAYGVTEEVPRGYLAQIIYPFSRPKPPI